eukprot:maker-scaffold_5-snap-gene-6.47-mRNA-1 protein AED:0.07 eAED:0.07 QI:17/1/1/1/0.8/0.66/6/158/474
MELILGKVAKRVKKFSLVAEAMQTEDPEKKYEKLETLGEGSYGAVYKVSGPDGQILAMKKVPLEDDMTMPELLKEIEILKECDNPFVTKYEEHFELEESVYILMELCEAGSMSDIMQWCKLQFDEEVLRHTIAAATLGLAYLQEKDILHRDIKAANLLLNFNGQLKLADFGVSAKLGPPKHKRNTVIGTPYWMAPEVIKAKDYDFVVDSWSLGITLIELAQSEPPHASMHPMRVILFIADSSKAPRLRSKKQWSSEMRSFLKECTRIKTADRFTAQQLLEHEWIQETVDMLVEAQPKGHSQVLFELVNDDDIKEMIVQGRKEEEEERRKSLNRKIDDSSSQGSEYSDAVTAIFIPDGEESLWNGADSDEFELEEDKGDTPLYIPNLGVLDNGTKKTSGKEKTLVKEDGAELIATPHQNSPDEGPKFEDLLKKELLRVKAEIKELERQHRDEVKDLQEKFALRRKALRRQKSLLL